MTEEAQIAGQDIGGGEPAEQPQLSIADLQNLRAIVDVAVRRGVFAANEISAVGAVYDRVNKFLNVVAPPQAEATPAEKAE